ncbi:MAG: DUF2868 domain-containing protein [Planctomycetia bacterium]|nr:DUF2868 domain-containing protein [Planctomycetia bacterium]
MRKKTAFAENNVFDWLPIQLLRLNEQNRDINDFEAPFIEAEKDELGHLIRPVDYLSTRAEILLPKYLGISKKTIRKIMLLMFCGSCFLTIILGIVIYPLMWANSILESRFVNLAGPFVYFLIGQLFFLALSFLFILLTFIFSFLAWLTPGRSSRRISRLADFFVWLSGITGSFMISVMRWISMKFSRLWKQKEVDLLNEKRVNIISEFFNYLFLNRQSLLFWGSMLSHLFWLTMSLCVLIILIIKMQGNLYDYCWKTSLGNKDQIQYYTKILGTPFDFLDVVPDSDDVLWLISNSEVSFTNRPQKTIDQSDQAARTTWSYFLLFIVLSYCIIPRFVLTYCYWILFLISLRNFRPNLKSDYFVKLLALEEDYLTQTESQQIFDDEQIVSNETVNSNVNDSLSQTTFYSEKELDKNASIENNNIENQKGLVESGKIFPATRQSTPIFVVEGAWGLIENQTLDENRVFLAGDQKEAISNSSYKIDEFKNNDLCSINSTNLEETVSSGFGGQTAENRFYSLSQDQSEFKQNENILISHSDTATLSNKNQQHYILVLGYDAEMPNDFWNELLGDSSNLICFGNIVKNEFSKRSFFKWFNEHSSEVEKCIVLTDYSLPPAKQFILFLQDDLLKHMKPISFFLILSCGEKLRKKFHNDISSISERTNDWKNIVFDLNKKNQSPIQSVYFDHELNLLTARNHLKQILESNNFENGSFQELIHPDYSFLKMNQSFSLILEESSAVFKSSQPFSEENECERLKIFYEKLIRIYRDENEYLTAKSQLFFQEKSKAEESFVTNAQKILSNLSSNVDLQYIKETVLPAASVFEKTKALCSHLSPKCALAMASVGASIPVAITLAPFVAGTTSLVALTGALSSLLPSVAFSGAAGAAIGATLPQSFHLFKKKLTEKVKRLNPFSSKDSSTVELPNQSIDTKAAKTQEADSEGNSVSDEILQENILKINSFVCAATTWVVVLELQAYSEDVIAEKISVILQPLESSSLESLYEIETVLDNVKTNLIEIGREKQ